MSADPYFFGYGSLVNRWTHDFADARPARLTGWRRAWCHTELRPIAFLTAVPEVGAEIEGLIARVPGADWAALDEREYAYDRIGASAAVTHDLPEAPEIAVYAVPAHRQREGDTAHPILLSYLDVVVQGYLREFGEAGVARFFETTSGWEAPVLNDRAAPRYPRSQTLEPAQVALVDRHLAALGAQVMVAAEEPVRG